MYKDIVAQAREDALKFMKATPHICALMKYDPQLSLLAAKDGLIGIRKRLRACFKEKAPYFTKQEAAYHIAFAKEMLRLAEENVKNHRPNQTMHDILTRIAILQSQHATKH